MARKRRYPLEFRREIVALAREFEPSASAIRKWVKQADLDEGHRNDGLTTFERQELRQARREIKRLRMERDILIKAAAWFARESDSIPGKDSRRVKVHRARFPIRVMCRVLGLSPSGYYAWLKRRPSKRARRDEMLREKIVRIWNQNRRVYGRPRLHAEFTARRERTSPKRVGRLMKEAGIRGASRRRRKAGLTRRDRKARPAPDLVNRNFAVERPDQLWVADLTYVRTQAGWLYVAVVVDAWSRRVVGWAMETHLRSELVEKALAMAVIRRQPKQVIHLKVSRFHGRFSREPHKRELQAQYERLTPAKLHQRIEHLKDARLDRHRRRSRSTGRAATSGLPSGRSFFEATDDTSSRCGQRISSVPHFCARNIS